MIAEQLWHYRARVAYAHDGDTLEGVVVDVGFGLTYTAPRGLRLLGINSPELHDKDVAVRFMAQQALAFVTAWLLEHAEHLGGGCTRDWPWAIRTTKTDDFARLLAVLECGQGHDLSTAMLDSGNAVPMVGR